MSWVLIAVLIAIGLALLWLMGIYNRLIQMRNQVKNAWSQIDVQLRRRYDLIPNLIETVKGYMGYEKSTLEAVVNARNQAQQARQAIEKSGGPTETSLQDLNLAEKALHGALVNVMALVENYPQLRASESMQTLQEELRTTENKIAFSRQAYNDTAMLYNITQQEFPANMVANTFGHHPIDLFEIEEGEVRKPVKVTF
jgi:LemA protein